MRPTFVTHGVLFWRFGSGHTRTQCALSAVPIIVAFRAVVQGREDGRMAALRGAAESQERYKRGLSPCTPSTKKLLEALLALA